MSQKEPAPHPAFLGPEFASAFQEASVARAYPRRSAYPQALIEQLQGLLRGESRATLDIGAGTGDLARRLAPQVERVDAVDWSAAMIAVGQRLRNGRHPRLRWIQGRIEEVTLDPPYALVTAGESLHWMNWPTVLPLLGRALVPGGYLAIAHRDVDPTPWEAEMQSLFRRFSTNQAYQPYNLIEELRGRGLFDVVGNWAAPKRVIRRSVARYLEWLHSTSGFARERMGERAAEAFDEALRATVAPHLDTAGHVRLRVGASLVWGTPGEG